MQFFIHYNFFCQEYKFTFFNYLLTYFSQTRDAGNEIATFHPGHNTTLKSLS